MCPRKRTCPPMASASTEGNLTHTVAMAAGKDVDQAEPEFAARVRRLFETSGHRTIATLRADGSPRISGMEYEFAYGELGSRRCRGRALRRGSEAGSQVRPAWSGSAPTGGKGGRVAGRGEDRRPGGSRLTGRRRVCWRSVPCRQFRGRHHSAEAGGNAAGHRVVDSATGATRGGTRMRRASTWGSCLGL